MKKFLKKIYLLPVCAATLSVTSCLDTVEPSSVASREQVENTDGSFDMLVSGLNSMMMQINTYGTGTATASCATADWGYPCYMMWREVMCDGFPSTGSSWNYQYTLEAGTYLTSYTAYPYYYYYNFINNTNNILKQTDEKKAETFSTIEALGKTRTYRALCYMELTNFFEFYKTGITALDAAADSIIGLTVPIVTETTTAAEAKNNPRAPFYKMYRFINNDLTLAEADLRGTAMDTKSDVSADVVNGLKARFWLTLATRFERNADDLTTQLAHEGDDDGYEDLGITNVADCYKKAQSYAEKVINAGYVPMTANMWNSTTDGFNTANQAWVWCIRFSSSEQIARYWCSLHGILASEPTWAMSAYGGEYRCISKKLYDKMGDGDWRKMSWVAPKDAGSKTVPQWYATVLKDENEETEEANTNWSRLPAYANLKFRAAGGNMDSEEEGLLVDVPLMRVEEMYFIKMEAALHLEGLAAAKTQLEYFLNTFRYTDGSYTCDATTESDFVDEMIAQKYIEFWGEGIIFNDYKRLGLAVDRTGDDSNYLSSYQLKSYDGYTAPWMNLYIPEQERKFNKGIKMNPNPTTYVATYCK